VLLALLLPAAASSAFAQASISLTLDSPTVAFPSADPDTTPVLISTPLRVTVFVPGNRDWNLTVIAGGDLMSGSSTIDIGQVSWTATPDPFRGGTLSRSVAQTVAQATGGGTRVGTLTFRLNNSWNYAPGTYTQALTFTLTVP
jgi:hypothetical protein